MTIIADTSIPFAEHYFEQWGEVRLVDAEKITPTVVADADVLLVRSVTRVDRGLLGASSVRFVGSATIGTDHVDLDWIADRGIAFAHAPGSNADSVVEYVIAALLAVHAQRGMRLQERTLGIVGKGNIGGRLAARVAALGLEVLVCDPPLSESDPDGDYVDLDVLLETSDIVTLHCPLTRVGPHATHHLIDGEALARMRPGAWLINTSRGAVVDNGDLLEVIQNGHLGASVLDVWEGEPEPDPRLIEACDLATPHIAGYSIDGKIAGTIMLAEAFGKWKGEGASHDDPPMAPGVGSLSWPPSPRSEVDRLHLLTMQMYDIRQDDLAMRSLIEMSAEERRAAFLALRRHYPDRYTFSRYRLENPPPAELREQVAVGLGLGQRKDGAKPSSLTHHLE